MVDEVSEIDRRMKVIEGLTALAEEALDKLQSATEEANICTNSYSIKIEGGWRNFYRAIKRVIEDENLYYFPQEIIERLNRRYEEITGEKVRS